MQFLINFLRNLLLLLVLCAVLYLFFPDLLGQVFNMFGQLFGPLAILLIIVAALPGRKRDPD